MTVLIDSLNYRPTELAFGTSGLRGLIADMTDLECYINTVGFLRYAKTLDGEFNDVYVAGDLRSSTPRIMQAVARAIEDENLVHENCGLIPTPAVALRAYENNQPCIMVTGSHIPDDRNGIKFYKCSGEVLKADEAEIKASVAAVRAEIYAEETGRFGVDGQFVEEFELNVELGEASESYDKRFLDFFAPDALAGMKIVMYQHSSVSRDIIPTILKKLGAEVIETGRSDVFIPIDTENVTPQDEAYFKTLAAENPDCSAIISTDGDGDRPFVVDETGVFNRGDMLGVVVAEFLGSSTSAIPVSSNDAALAYFENNNIKYALTKIGSPHVIVAMEELSKTNENVTGWEVNGGFLVGAEIQMSGKTLAPLPTRDALLPIICALISAKQQDIKLSELFAELPARYTQAGLIDNFPNVASKRIIDVLAADDNASRAMIAEIFTKDEGFGAMQKMDSTDGVRIKFENGDVAHLRPSGNAPQLRMYSNADSQARADEIVALAIEEPNGILRCLESYVTNL